MYFLPFLWLLDLRRNLTVLEVAFTVTIAKPVSKPLPLLISKVLFSSLSVFSRSTTFFLCSIGVRSTPATFLLLTYVLLKFLMCVEICCLYHYNLLFCKSRAFIITFIITKYLINSIGITICACLITFI